MLSETPSFSLQEIKEIYEELDLQEDGISEEEIVRRKTRIFVGGLKFASEDHVLFDYFASFGKIKEAVVIRDRKTGLSKGYGFVTMLEDSHALRAIVDKSPKLDGRRCNVNLAYIGQKKKPSLRKSEVKMKDAYQFAQQISGYTNGYMVPPTVMMPHGQQYQLGLPPLHGHQPIYHVLPDTPSIIDTREVYQAQPAMTLMYQNPVFLSQPLADNPVNPVNLVNPVNNSSNIYLTNNIYYQPSEIINGQTQVKDNRKLSICGAMGSPAKAYEQPLRQPHFQPTLVPVNSEIFNIPPPNSINYGFDNHLPADVTNIHCESGSPPKWMRNTLATLNSNAYFDSKIHVIEGMNDYLDTNNTHVIVGALSQKNNENCATKFSSPTLPFCCTKAAINNDT